MTTYQAFFWLLHQNTIAIIKEQKLSIFLRGFIYESEKAKTRKWLKRAEAKLDELAPHINADEVIQQRKYLATIEQAIQ